MVTKNRFNRFKESPMRKQIVTGLEFRVFCAERAEVASTFTGAAAMAVAWASNRDETAYIDVVAVSEEAAYEYGGDESVRVYRRQRSPSGYRIIERIVVDTAPVFPRAVTNWDAWPPSVR